MLGRISSELLYFKSSKEVRGITTTKFPLVCLQIIAKKYEQTIVFVHAIHFRGEKVIFDCQKNILSSKSTRSDYRYITAHATFIHDTSITYSISWHNKKHAKC